ncbi:hypothetical protein [Streptomyces sp. NBC_00690]|uniref:hypothetical protein n=1 Tax=Streptomyces sp. NBC_00690 TaxID=2975808 RepID=UPI002E2AD045|nr:hypothetical protein [Streptomyces sp. NBC_00690]
MGNALLRRIALFHTVGAFYRVQCWDEGEGWKIDAHSARPHALGHDRLLERLCHLRWGLPVQVSDRFCFCGEPDTPGQWGHTCSFYFGSRDTRRNDPLYLRIHTDRGRCDHEERIGALREVGAPESWIARAFPQGILQPDAERGDADQLL